MSYLPKGLSVTVSKAQVDTEKLQKVSCKKKKKE